MTDKERLVELMKQGEDTTPCSFIEDFDCANIRCGDCEREAIADYLIANGVVVQKRGEWEIVRSPYGKIEGWMCNCGRISQEKSEYCPSCGAKLDLKEGK